MPTNPFIFRQAVDRDDPEDPTTEYKLDGVYDVYERATGRYLGQVVRRDHVHHGYWGAWEGPVATRRRQEGKYARTVSVRLAGDSRQDVARQMLARIEDIEKVRRGEYTS